MQSSRSGSRNVVGILLIALGVIFLLDTLDVFGEDSNIIGDYWPVVIIGIGFVSWARKGFTFELGPVIVMTIGGLLLIGSLTDWNVWQFWPVILIIIGLWFVWRHRLPMRTSTGETLTGDGTVNASAIFGGNEQRIGGEFKGGRVTAVMGGGKLNLLDATLPTGGAVLDVSAVMGSYEVIVPSTWRVVLNVDALLGGVEDKREVPIMADDSQPALDIRGSAIMGSVEIKSR